MEFTELSSYFKEYLTRFLPYSKDKLYEVLMNFVVDNHLKNLYDINIENFKEIFENSNIIIDVYDQLLFGIGVPEKVIYGLNFNEKLIFLNSLADFQRYRGSVLFFENVAKSFSDKFSIYELYADYLNGEWVLKPRKIFISEICPEITIAINYDSVYQKIPSLLISESYLNELKDNNNAVFPIKTNLILLDYNISSNVNNLTNLIIATILKDYGEEKVKIYFTDSNFDLSLKETYFFWHYILSLFYSTTWIGIPFSFLVNFSNYYNNYSLIDIDNLVNELNELDNISDISQFYNDNIQRIFFNSYKSSNTTPSELRETLGYYNYDLLIYYENRINGLVDNELKNEINNILTEVYNSLILFYKTSVFDQYFIKYFEIFLQSLSHIIINPEETTSYLILSNMKPFHVELVSQSRTSILADGKFNTVTPKDSDFNFLFTMARYNLLTEMEDLGLFSFKYWTSDLVDFSTMFEIGYFLKKEEEISKRDIFSTAISKYFDTVYDLSDQYLQKFYKIHPEFLDNDDYFQQFIKFSKSTSFQYSDNFVNKIIKLVNNLINISTDLSYKFKFSPISSLEEVDVFLAKLSIMLSSNLILNDISKTILRLNNGDLINFNTYLKSLYLLVNKSVQNIISYYNFKGNIISSIDLSPDDQSIPVPVIKKQEMIDSDDFINEFMNLKILTINNLEYLINIISIIKDNANLQTSELPVIKNIYSNYILDLDIIDNYEIILI